MRVLTFAPALAATEDDGGGVSVDGFPMTHCFVSEFPTEITITMVLVVCTLAGEEYSPCLLYTSPSPRDS